MAWKEYPSQTRMKQRMNVLRQLVEGNQGVESKKAIAVMSLRFGLKERTIREYLTILINSGILIEDDGRLYETAQLAAADEGSVPSDELSPDERKFLDAALVVPPEVENKEIGEEHDKKPRKRKRGRPKGS